MTLKPPVPGGSPIADRVDVIFEAPLNVQYPEFGARGDGTTDDAPALNAAATAARQSAGKIILPYGEYRCGSTLNLGGITVEGIPRGAGATASQAVIRHWFNGNLIDAGTQGMQLRNLALYEGDSTLRTGAAVVATSTPTDPAGGIVMEHITISSTAGWERLLILDGTAHATLGVRQVCLVNCNLFGARTAGEAVVIKNGVHIKFIGGQLDPAPTAVQQGIRVENTNSTDVEFVGYEVIGDFYTEAAGDLVYTGRITGTITCAASSARNVFIGRVGTFTNSGDVTNMQLGSGSSGPVSPSLSIASNFAARQNFENGIAGSAATTNGAKRLSASGGSGGSSGLMEVNSVLSVSDAHAYGSFPNPGTGKVYAHKGLAVGNSASATTPGTVVKKIEVFDATGSSLGFVPVYGTIT